MSDIEVGAIESIKALSLGPRDVVVVRVQQPLSIEARHTIAFRVVSVLQQAGLDNKVLVLDGGATLEALRVENESPAAGENGS